MAQGADMVALPETQWVLKTACGWDVQPAEVFADEQRATDLIANDSWHVIVRLQPYKQFPKSFGEQFMLCSWRGDGGEDELGKMLMGFGDWLLYGFVEYGEYRHFRIFNLMVFRQAVGKCGIDNFRVRSNIPNHDETMFYDVFDIGMFLKPRRFPICFKEGAC